MTEFLKPENEAQAQEIICQHFQSGEALAVCGGNTRSGFGNPVNADKTLTSSVLSGIVAYNPSEMVMTAKAGTSLAEVEAALAKNAQFLAFEPMDHRGIMGTNGAPTIGGVFAANVSGPRRFALAGSARDHLLGVRFVNGKGEVVKSGGRVMKNVTGLDLVKLMAGSFGTLGFMSEVTFKVLPAPKAAATVVIDDLPEDEAIRVMAAVMALPVEISGAAHLPYNVRGAFLDGALSGDTATCFRIEGLVESVAVRCETLKAYLRPFGAVNILDDDQTGRLWQQIRDVKPYADGLRRPLWRVSVTPSSGAALVGDMRLESAVDAFYDWQGGLIWMRMEGGPEAEILRALIKKHGGGHARLLSCDEVTRRSVATFDPQPAAVADLVARIRTTFDPKGIFNPGKMDK